ncbi:Hypothetical predicted protein [Lecanosticta acicola]|uniref:Uncharacterized protein n=1 Tax=Lecanosticta acicola TaxID=111012 RepID=A0AAI8Z5A3_9PEZI|nr:Hypothetical predicted protein [Lecanosticta acicola]
MFEHDGDHSEEDSEDGSYYDDDDDDDDDEDEDESSSASSSESSTSSRTDSTSSSASVRDRPDVLPRQNATCPPSPLGVLKIFLVSVVIGTVLSGIFGNGNIENLINPRNPACNMTRLGGEPCALLLDTNRLLSQHSLTRLSNNPLPHRAFFPREVQIRASEAELLFISAIELRAQTNAHSIESLEDQIRQSGVMGNPGGLMPEEVTYLRMVAEDPGSAKDTKWVLESAENWLREVRREEMKIRAAVEEICRSWSRLGHLLFFLKWAPARYYEHRLESLRTEYAQYLLIEIRLVCFLRGEEALEAERVKYVQSLDGSGNIKERYKRLVQVLEYSWRPVAVEMACATECMDAKFRQHCLVNPLTRMETKAIPRVWREWNDMVPVVFTGSPADTKRFWKSHYKSPGELLRAHKGKLMKDGGGVAVKLREDVPPWKGAWSDLKQMMSRSSESNGGEDGRRAGASRDP